MLDIVTRARVSKRDLYALFKNKHAVLAACIGERTQQMRLPLDPAVPMPQTRPLFCRALGRSPDPAIAARAPGANQTRNRCPCPYCNGDVDGIVTCATMRGSCELSLGMNTTYRCAISKSRD
jgi:AcrR family transcriptional regulator